MARLLFQTTVFFYFSTNCLLTKVSNVSSPERSPFQRLAIERQPSSIANPSQLRPCLRCSANMVFILVKVTSITEIYSWQYFCEVENADNKDDKRTITRLITRMLVEMMLRKRMMMRMMSMEEREDEDVGGIKTWLRQRKAFLDASHTFFTPEAYVQLVSISIKLLHNHPPQFPPDQGPAGVQGWGCSWWWRCPPPGCWRCPRPRYPRYPHWPSLHSQLFLSEPLSSIRNPNPILSEHWKIGSANTVTLKHCDTVLWYPVVRHPPALSRTQHLHLCHQGIMGISNSAYTHVLSQLGRVAGVGWLSGSAK